MSLFRNPPKTRYADTGEGYVAYVEFGSGPTTILFETMMVTNVEMMWESPDVCSFFDQLARCGRVIVAEYRGIGVSDPFPMARNPSFDDTMVDVVSVLDDADVDECVLIGDVEVGAIAAIAAATYPSRIERLILLNAIPRTLRAPDYPIGMPDETFDAVSRWVEESWAKPAFFVPTAPHIANDERLTEWLGRFQRLSNSPNAARQMFNWYRDIDVRAILSTIRQETLVIARTDAAYHRADYGRYLASQIPNSKYIELPGHATSPYFLADPGPVLASIEEWLTGAKPERVVNRTLATVLFTDIVDSTGLAASLGDESWLRVLDRHNQICRESIAAFRGHEIKTTGDGVIATFDGPTRALTCAVDIREALGEVDLQIRAGLHTGEIELKDDGDIAGVAVHIASRVMSEAHSSAVVVSNTVKDLVAGSGVDFQDLGEKELKGVPGSWHLYEVADIPVTLR